MVSVSWVICLRFSEREVDVRSRHTERNCDFHEHRIGTPPRYRSLVSNLRACLKISISTERHRVVEEQLQCLELPVVVKPLLHLGGGYGPWDHWLDLDWNRHPSTINLGCLPIF